MGRIDDAPDGTLLLVTSKMTGELTLADPSTLAIRGRVRVGRCPSP
jgi:hypothetical protein